MDTIITYYAYFFMLVLFLQVGTFVIERLAATLKNVFLPVKGGLTK